MQPSWAKKPLINAQYETVSEKKTFKKAYAEHRCIVPCCGWYEWKDEGAARKQKYLFQYKVDYPLFMAGIYYESDIPELVTLTTSANEQCAKYHPRMPLLIESNLIQQWLKAPISLVSPTKEGVLTVSRS